jgi:hypothetical protein
MTDQSTRVEALALRDRLDAEHERYKRLVTLLPVQEARLQEDSRRYLCLRCAGFLEQLTYLTVRHFLSKKASGPALEFAHSYFVQAPNLRVAALKKLFARFGPADEARIDAFLSKPRSDVLSDLMSIRNPVAHGEVIGGAKLDPARYLELCHDYFDWCTAEYLSD